MFAKSLHRVQRYPLGGCVVLQPLDCDRSPSYVYPAHLTLVHIRYQAIGVLRGNGATATAAGLGGRVTTLSLGSCATTLSLRVFKPLRCACLAIVVGDTSTAGIIVASALYEGV